MDGILVIDKPQGMTSHDVVDLVRKKFRVKKAGHAGTLDPMATGVLVLLIGKCTKLSGRFISDDKDYEGSLVLGATSDTLDAWGKITPGGRTADIEEEDVKKAFAGFMGEIEQLPPMYSAVKLQGKKLYELARKGIEVKREPRKVHIKRFDITRIELPKVNFSVTCSKGTYVRQLCADIGASLGSGAYLSELKRMRSGVFTIDKAVKMDELLGSGMGDLEKRLVNCAG
ncbi:MAG: tRNA pseudouridine(55) synthase TruB [Candidatus Omnitrophota bacterium]